MHFASITIFGKLKDHPEMKFTTNQKPYAVFTLVCERKTKNRDGDWSKTMDFYNCKAWGSISKNICDYMHKDSEVIVTGKFSFWSKKREDGSWDKSAQVDVTDCTFISRVKADKENTAESEAGKANWDPPETTPTVVPDDMDIPF